ncbi:hypothetical protein KSZ12_20295 [Parabacteroides distasonis]|jgi:hypothetical protein|uniref:CRISPR-associated endonuclease Cas6 n=1 Tax=Parabacteroides distasonis TaxID=823 RepID=UPI001C3948B0|nr:CRISPR-associated endonuclease Cas6 [Parabacteroides distasonis]MBV4228153.1 hypothetical protein [Parabacteroides distasonis]
MRKIRILCVRFHNELQNNEIEMFRGAVLSKLPEASVLFHNHMNDNFRYSYPLIQYKRLFGKAALVCLEEGTEAIGELFSAGDFCFRIGDRAVRMEIESICPQQVVVQPWESSFAYRMHRWLPFNEDNYRIYHRLEGLAERYDFLEKKLIGNILSFAKGLGIYFDTRLTCKILEVENPYWITYKGVRMMAFNVRFKTNVSLPDNIGLGKGVSLGNGTIYG